MSLKDLDNKTWKLVEEDDDANEPFENFWLESSKVAWDESELNKANEEDEDDEDDWADFDDFDS